MNGDAAEMARRAGKVMRACLEGRAAPLRLATAESCTGGLLSAALTEAPGASRYFQGGIVAYDNAVKIARLNVPPAVLAEHGAVSAPTAQCMAENVRGIFEVDLGVSISGIAGPGGGAPGKPVGLVFIAVSGPRGTGVRRFVFAGDRGSVRRKSCIEALNAVYLQARNISEEESNYGQENGYGR